MIHNAQTAQLIPDSQLIKPNAKLLANQTILFHTEVPAHHANQDISPPIPEPAKEDQAPLLWPNHHHVVSDNTESAHNNVVPAQLTLMYQMMEIHVVDANKIKLLLSTVAAIHAHMDNTLTTEEPV